MKQADAGDIYLIRPVGRPHQPRPPLGGHSTELQGLGCEGADIREALPRAVQHAASGAGAGDARRARARSSGCWGDNPAGRGFAVAQSQEALVASSRATSRASSTRLNSTTWQTESLQTAPEAASRATRRPARLGAPPRGTARGTTGPPRSRPEQSSRPSGTAAPEGRGRSHTRLVGEAVELRVPVRQPGWYVWGLQIHQRVEECRVGHVGDPVSPKDAQPALPHPVPEVAGLDVLQFDQPLLDQRAEEHPIFFSRVAIGPVLQGDAQA